MGIDGGDDDGDGGPPVVFGFGNGNIFGPFEFSFTSSACLLCCCALCVMQWQCNLSCSIW